MHSLINRQGLVDADPWVLARGDDGALAPQAGRLVPLAAWEQSRAALLAGEAPLGVLLESDDDPARLVRDLDRLSLVAVRFPTFTDGRGFSIARRLRGRHGYRGELRATGPLVRDVLFYLARCGFDSFELREGEDPVASMAELAAFDMVYQAASDRPGPLGHARAVEPACAP